MPENQVYLFVCKLDLLVRYTLLFLVNSSPKGHLQVSVDECEELAPRAPVERIIRVARGGRVQDNVSVGARMASMHAVVQIDQVNCTWYGLGLRHACWRARHDGVLGSEVFWRIWQWMVM